MSEYIKKIEFNQGYYALVYDDNLSADYLMSDLSGQDEYNLIVVPLPLYGRTAKSHTDSFHFDEFLKEIFKKNELVDEKKNKFLLEEAVHYAFNQRPSREKREPSVEDLEIEAKKEALFWPDIYSENFRDEFKEIVNEFFSLNSNDQKVIGSDYLDAKNFFSLIEVLCDKFDILCASDRAVGYSQGEECLLFAWMPNKMRNRNFNNNDEEARTFLKNIIFEYGSVVYGDVYFFDLFDENEELVTSCGGFIGKDIILKDDKERNYMIECIEDEISGDLRRKEKEMELSFEAACRDIFTEVN